MRALLVVCMVALLNAAASAASHYVPVTVHVFYENMIHFLPDDSGRYDTPVHKARDNGREVVRTVDLGDPPSPAVIKAHFSIKPIPKDEKDVYDRWDRAGHVRMSVPGMDDIEVVKFMTAYGGPSEYTVDVTHLAPLLQGKRTFTAWVDTWVSPAWRVDFSLEFRPVTAVETPDWVHGVFFELSMEEDEVRDDPMTRRVIIPTLAKKVVMHYLVSGHCTDGRGADEFESKDNVITVDGKEVWRFKPWRDDCWQFRTVNPYCRRWSDGSWSSDYSRSNWCPSDKVDPIVIDLTEHLTPGEHTIGFRVENIRPREGDHLGYWRISSYLLAWLKE